MIASLLASLSLSIKDDEEDANPRSGIRKNSVLEFRAKDRPPELLPIPLQTPNRSRVTGIVPAILWAYLRDEAGYRIMNRVPLGGGML
jgi:hypothetical protein